MKKTIVLFLVIQLGMLPLFSQQPAPQVPAAPATKKIIVQTPFGPKEYEVPVDASAPVNVLQPEPRQVQTPVVPAPPAATPTAAQPEPAPQQPAAPQAPDEIVPISLQFDNAQDIYGIIKIIMGTLNLNYYIDPAVKGSINIVTNGNLRRSDLLPILELILKINGATMVKTGNIYGILPAGNVMHEALEVQERSSPATSPDDQFVMQIVRMKFVAASEMANLLSPFLSPGANVLTHSSGNILLITERKTNLRKLLEIVDTFDTNVFEDQRVRLMPIRNNLAREVVLDLNSVFSGYGLSQSATAIRFVPIERLNSVLVITPNALVFPEVEKWLSRLDQNIVDGGVQNFVYKVKNSKASDIQNVLAQLYGSQLQLSSIYNQPSGVAPLTPAVSAPVVSAPPNPLGTPPPAAQSSSPAGTLPNMASRVGDIRIIADVINNFLVIQSTPQVYKAIERTIVELDVLPRQVLIDAQIYEVSLDNSLQFGISATLQTRGTLSNPATTASFVAPSFAAQTFAFVGRSRELLLFLNASENRSRVRTLSAPSVMVSDNMSADFQVGAEVPIPTSSSITPVQSGGTNLFAQTIQFRPTGVLLRVKPQINDSGNVTLDVSQEVSQAGVNTTSAVAAPVISKSSVNSTIVVRDGETIAMGGFIRENSELSKSRIPLLGRIPVAGALFGNTLKTAGRNELIILITPHVLRTHTDADSATDELKAKLKEVQKMLK